MASHTDDATMFGRFGGYEQGWEAVAERYRWAAANAESAVHVALIACHVGDTTA